MSNLASACIASHMKKNCLKGAVAFIIVVSIYPRGSETIENAGPGIRCITEEKDLWKQAQNSSASCSASVQGLP